MSFRSTLLAASLLSALTLTAGAEPSSRDQRIAVPLTDPGRPVRLEVGFMAGQIEVTGYDGREVVVLARTGTMSIESSTSGGMKRIPNTALGLTVEEHQNNVQVSGENNNQTVVVEIQVPVRTSAAISTVNGGDIVVHGLSGELELHNTNGGIVATGIRGSVVAETTNGDVRVTFVEVEPSKPMAFTTLNGDVDVTFPANLKADIRIDPGRGDILTDFDVDVLPTTPEIQRHDSGKGYRVEMGQDVRGKIGGGGPTFHFKTFNGSIFIRKTKG